jgi:hypothetical protein
MVGISLVDLSTISGAYYFWAKVGGFFHNPPGLLCLTKSFWSFPQFKGASYAWLKVAGFGFSTVFWGILRLAQGLWFDFFPVHCGTLCLAQGWWFFHSPLWRTIRGSRLVDFSAIHKDKCKDLLEITRGLWPHFSIKCNIFEPWNYFISDQHTVQYSTVIILLGKGQQIKYLMVLSWTILKLCKSF